MGRTFDKYPKHENAIIVNYTRIGRVEDPMELVFEDLNWLRPKVKIEALKNILESEFGAHTHTQVCKTVRFD